MVARPDPKRQVECRRALRGSWLRNGTHGRWLARKGVREIDGVDATSEMLDQDRKRDVFASLRVADVCTTGLPKASYDLIVTCQSVSRGYGGGMRFESIFGAANNRVAAERASLLR
ncbi:methyltransferase domain-containing protein [Chlorogloeopsis sp. ULAP02]|uniref:methyltransferase domain-containing protein n=1 Tax=Chlorogloeopsis sp. ULAP02 TaxID=3107926 RepID=UPI00398B73B3